MTFIKFIKVNRLNSFKLNNNKINNNKLNFKLTNFHHIINYKYSFWILLNEIVY